MSAAKNRNTTKKSHKPSLLRRVLTWAIISVIMVLFILGTSILILDEERPTGDDPIAADELARQIEVATGQASWSEIPAISWLFAGRNEHFWDKIRNLHFVRFANGTEVRLCLDSEEGDVQSVSDDTLGAELIHEAMGYFYNDSFWLNPFGKLFDPGVSRLISHVEDQQALRIHFSIGGHTPGDTYLIFTNANGLPTQWKMWVSIIPIGGLAASWSDWHDLSNGAMVARRHEIGPRELIISDVIAGDFDEVASSFGFEGDPFDGLSCAN